MIQSENSADATVARLAERLLAGESRALARAISLVEDDAPSAQALLSACFQRTGEALRIGITGAPGAGKSTLVDQLARAFREQQHKVGILAVDPTSPFSGGAILGDRIRMERHHADAGVYARSMATRGAMGGLARAAADAAMLIEASGRDRILIETVGVGQDEIDIVRLADITLVVLVPGMGDDVQSIKAGILEIADIFIVNKSDREGADRVEKELKAMQSFAGSHGSWVAPVVRTVASTGQGTDELVAAIGSFTNWLQKDGHLQERRQQQWRERLTEMIRAELLRGLRAHALTPDELAEHACRIAARQEDPFAMASRLVNAITGGSARTSARIDHLGIAVQSIAAAQVFYEALGLRVTHEETVADEGVRVAMLPVGDSRVELLEPLGPETVVGRFLSKRGPGLHHIALHVDDIESTWKELRERGVALVSPAIQTGAGGHLYFFVHPKSTGGALLEICKDPA